MPYSLFKQRIIVTGLILGLLLASIEQTVVTTAMPTIVKELGGLSVYSWVFSIYMLTSTASMPLYGKLADVYGRKTMYIIGMLLFLAGSVLCGLSTGMTGLIVSRGIQGIGAGALMPIAFTIMADLFPPEQRGKFMGTFSAVFTLASLLGPTVGGILVQYAHWSSVFYLNLPIGIPALLLIAFSLKERTGSEQRHVDWFGAITFTSAIVAVLLALVLGGEPHAGAAGSGWLSAPVIGLLSAGVLLLCLFLWMETKVKEPLIPLALFRHRLIASSSITGFLISAAMFGAIAYIPLYLQGVIGASPSAAGYTLTPLMLASAITSTLCGRLMSKLSYRAILIPSFLFMAAGFCLLSRMTIETTMTQIVITLILTGLGMGAVFPVLGTAAQSAVEWNMRGVATSMSQFCRSIGGTIGVSVLGALLAARTASGLLQGGRSIPADQVQQYANPQLLLDAGARAALPQPILESLQLVFSDALQAVFAASAVCVVLALAASLWMGNHRLVQPSSDKKSA